MSFHQKTFLSREIQRVIASGYSMAEHSMAKWKMGVTELLILFALHPHSAPLLQMTGLTSLSHRMN